MLRESELSPRCVDDDDTTHRLMGWRKESARVAANSNSNNIQTAEFNLLSHHVILVLLLLRRCSCHACCLLPCPCPSLQAWPSILLVVVVVVLGCQPSPLPRVGGDIDNISGRRGGRRVSSWHGEDVSNCYCHDDDDDGRKRRDFVLIVKINIINQQ